LSSAGGGLSLALPLTRTARRRMLLAGAPARGSARGHRQLPAALPSPSRCRAMARLGVLNVALRTRERRGEICALAIGCRRARVGEIFNRKTLVLQGACATW